MFTVTLPLLSSDGLVAGNGQKTSRDPKQTQPDLNGVHVLLVDDDAGRREMISAALHERQARVTAVGSAQEALSEIKRARPDVWVSDIAMPVQDGYQLIEEIRALELGYAKTIPGRDHGLCARRRSPPRSGRRLSKLSAKTDRAGGVDCCRCRIGVRTACGSGRLIFGPPQYSD